MPYMQEMAAVCAVEHLAPGVCLVKLNAPGICQQAVPGQFVQILVEGRQLRRPISLAGIDRDAGTLTLVFEARGEGTRQMLQVSPGQTWDLIGPLGNGFPLPSANAVALVGGGIGNPPMLPLAQYYQQAATVISGFRTANAVILQPEFQACGRQTILCTDDGSAGFAGFTTQALELHLQEHPCEAIFTCGPLPMMRGVAAIARAHGVPCYVSLEERMGCGFGACVGCAVDIQGRDGTVLRQKVCTDGPVFLAEEVIWA